MSCQVSAPNFNRRLHRFAVCTAVATFCLLGAGGLVTSHGVGMAVPDWPNTYGYNMFFFPISSWVGGIFYEHSHRLLASAVGLMTTVLSLWVYGKSSRVFLRWAGVVLMVGSAGTVVALPRHWQDGLVAAAAGLCGFGASSVWPRCEPGLRWLRRLGLLAFFAVVLQGVLGGLRVVLLKDQLGIFHATLAQLFFALTCALALFTSRWWLQRDPEVALTLQGLQGAGLGSWEVPIHRLRVLIITATCVILGQLVLGATMRHQHAGLAIPDFPLAYGKLWPAMDPQSVTHYNQQRVEILDANAITAFQIGLQMAHRLVAMLILGMVGYCAWLARRQLGRATVPARLAAAWLGVILLQALLGAATIWTNKAADVATAHVLTGALALALGVLLSLVSQRPLAVSADLAPVNQERTMVPRPSSSPSMEPALPAGWQSGAATHPLPAAGID